MQEERCYLQPKLNEPRQVVLVWCNWQIVEINASPLQEAPFKPSVFGEPLDVIMDLQKENTTLYIPKIVTVLTKSVHDLNGSTSEGIFRVPGDADAVTELVRLLALLLLYNHLIKSPFGLSML